MAFIHGKVTSFKLDNSAGALQDLSTYCKTVTLTQTAELAETTTFQASAKTWVAGFTDGTFTVEGNWDSTLDAHMAGVVGDADTLSFDFGVDGASGVNYTGEAILTSYEVNSDIGDVTTWSAEFQVSGAIGRA